MKCFHFHVGEVCKKVSVYERNANSILRLECMKKGSAFRSMSQTDVYWCPAFHCGILNIFA